MNKLYSQQFKGIVPGEQERIDYELEKNRQEENRKKLILSPAAMYQQLLVHGRILDEKGFIVLPEHEIYRDIRNHPQAAKRTDSIPAKGKIDFYFQKKKRQEEEGDDMCLDSSSCYI